MVTAIAGAGRKVGGRCGAAIELFGVEPWDKTADEADDQAGCQCLLSALGSWHCTVVRASARGR
jgi:hypothetical protein